jgi:hypothetical protein
MFNKIEEYIDKKRRNIPISKEEFDEVENILNHEIFKHDDVFIDLDNHKQICDIRNVTNQNRSTGRLTIQDNN